MKDPTERFSDRVADYVRYRPHYPLAIIDLLEERFGLRPDWTIADIGSGTGISCERFLELGCAVIGVEPNREMREAAEAGFADRKNFRSSGGRAEATALEAASVDLCVSGQAFHWFDRPAARAEALRILREPKRALAMWNDWAAGDSPFLRDYASFLDARMPERAKSDHRNLGAADFDAYFGRGRWERATVLNPQRVDFEGLKGRLLSASYAPKRGEVGFEDTMAELQAIFARHASGGLVDFDYTTTLYFGEMGA
jgi:SAM-dependent methyltransferase